MKHFIDLSGVTAKEIRNLSDQFSGYSDKGIKLEFTNYYMKIGEKPYFGISGECHFSRVAHSRWEETILRMKMGGINIISTYIFWIHHEEEEGTFCFDGNKNIRKFVELCHKHKMYVIIRIGPFDHGEVRNGGLPDWLYGKPFEVRGLNPGFLSLTRIWYKKLAEQLGNLYYKDGGPIIGAQIENEYMHSAAPWEMTTGVTNEWIPGGSEGNDYMIALKKIAFEEGIITPFYTCTGWGGAATPTDEMLPLWGGYAYWPWIFYNWRGEHPATPEFIYRDYHNNSVPKTYNFEPKYEPESLPYACCEMGGGMANYYHYRFQLPYESIDAMANIKIAGGCNFLGYYMYCGGSNPHGIKTPYLNECQCPKISYDYQAPVGEFGQLRPSYFRLKSLHMFIDHYKELLCHMTTELPENSQSIKPEDVESFRYAVRTDGKGGFVFINNFQDHVDCVKKQKHNIELKLASKEILIPDISIEAGEEAILPFNLDFGGYRLVYAKAQPLVYFDSSTEYIKRQTFVFFCPEGMEPEYLWESRDFKEVIGEHINVVKLDDGKIKVNQDTDQDTNYIIYGDKGEVEIITLSRKSSLESYVIEENGVKSLLLSDCPILYDGNFRISMNPDNTSVNLRLMKESALYPKIHAAIINKETESLLGVEKISGAVFSGFELKYKEDLSYIDDLEIIKSGPSRYVITIPDCCKAMKEVILQIDYQGDVGQLFANGKLISDNFSNGATWEIGLNTIEELKKDSEMTLVITPLKNDVKIDVSSTMAGRMELESESIAKLVSIRIKPIIEVELNLR